MSDTNERVITAIATALETGLQHPGNNADKTPAVAILNPMFRTKGQPPHIADTIRSNNRVIAESIVYLIESMDCRITPTAEQSPTDAHEPTPAGENANLQP